MSVASRTNAHGSHGFYGDRTLTRTGYRDIDGSPVSFSQNETKSIEEAYSRKSMGKGDHYHPTGYSREVYSILDESNFAIRRVYPPVEHHSINQEESVQTGSPVYLSHPVNLLPLPNGGRYNDNCRSESITKALNNLGGAKATLGADLAQTKQAVNMFADEAFKGARMLIALKKGLFKQIPGILGLNRRKLGQTSKTIANAWLEFQYGWKPLVSSIHDTALACVESMQKPHTIKGTGRGRFQHEPTLTDDKVRWHCSGTYRWMTSLEAAIDNSALHSANSLGLTNPLSIAWELVPWSFAIDWFVPIGAVLEAATATYGLKFVRGQSTNRVDYEFDGQLYRTDSLLYDSLESPGHVRYGVMQFYRYPLEGFPHAELYADLTPFSTPRALNALALVRQLLS